MTSRWFFRDWQNRLAHLQCRLPGIGTPLWVLLLIVIVYVEVNSALEYLRYTIFATNAWDLGIFMQSLWTTGHGEGLLYYTAELPWNQSGSLLGVHWNPIIILFVPFYALWPTPETLFVIQTAAVGLSAFPLFAIIGRRIGPWGGVLLTTAYLVSPPILGGLYFDFHVEELIPVAALTLWVAWERERVGLFALSAAILLATSEFAPFLLGAIAFRFFLLRVRTSLKEEGPHQLPRLFRNSLRPFLLSVASVPLAFLFFELPKVFSPHTPPITQVGALGGSTSEIIGNLLTSPRLDVEVLSSLGSEKVLFLEVILMSTFALWVLNPLDSLPALPWLLVVLFSQFSDYTAPVGLQYVFLVVPFLFAATPGGILRARTLTLHAKHFFRRWRWPTLPLRLRMVRPVVWKISASAILIAIILVPNQVYFSPFSPLAHYPALKAGWLPNSQDAEEQRILALIPPAASVSAEPDLFPQVANRLHAYPSFVNGTQYVVFQVNSWWFTSRLPPPDPPFTWQETLEHNMTSNYGLLAGAFGMVLLKLGYEGLPVLFQPYEATAAPERFTLNHSALIQNAGAPLGSYIVPGPDVFSGPLWSGPDTRLPPGTFLITTYWEDGQPTSAAGLELTALLDPGGRVLGTWNITSTDHSGAWKTLSFAVHLPYAGDLELVGNGLGGNPTLLFGGFVATQVIFR